MRRNERARLDRKKAYYAAIPHLGKKSNANYVALLDGVKVEHTKQHKLDFEDERNIARHEASHAVATWAVGELLGVMQFNDELSDKDHHAAELVAVTVTGIPVREMRTKSTGERFVHGCNHAFITLAGVIGSGDSQSPNPLRQASTDQHMAQAVGRLTVIGGLTEKEAKFELLRIAPVVEEFFQNDGVRVAVAALAEHLVRARKVPGEYAVEIIEQAYEVGNSDEVKALKASAGI